MTLIPNTSIPVWQVELMFRQNQGDAQILAVFPTLTKADLIAVHHYVTAHMEEVGREIEEGQASGTLPTTT
jgi:uncharacterized protein (DUF433 family)